MAQINYEIAPRAHELIRDQIGLILADELLQQAAITYDDLFLARVFVQRSKPIQPEECPLVVVSVERGDLDNHTVIDSDGEFTFFVDVFTTGSADDNNRGDIVSSFEAQRLAGACQAILLNPVYVRLGFAPPFIMRSKVVSFEPGTIERGESTNLSVVRITLRVKAGQTEPASDPISTFVTQTQVFLSETDEGYLYSGEGTPIPPPVCNPVTYEITDTAENILYSGSIPSGGELNKEIQDSTVTNSDATYSASVNAEGSLVLPDITVTDSDGSTYTLPSVKDVFCTPCEPVKLYVGELGVGEFPSGSDVFVKVIQDGLEVIPEDVTVVDDEVNIILADTPPCHDTNIEVNGVSEGSVSAGSTVDVQLSDSGGTVTPDSVTLVGNDLQIVLPDAVAPTDPDVTAFLTATGITDATIEGAIEGLVINLKSQGLWTKMKAIYPFVGGLASTHKFNLKNPLDTDAAFRIVFSGGWTHSATGAKPNGTNAYGDTKFNLASNLTTTSGSFGVYSRTNISEAGYDISHSSGNYWGVISRWVDNTFYAMYGHTFVNVANTDSRGLFTVNRLGATNTEGYKNGLRVINSAIATTTLQNANIALSAPSASPSTQFSSKELAFAYISDGLTQAEQNALYNLVQLFQITLSRNV